MACKVFIGPVVHSVERCKVTLITRALIAVQGGKILEIRELSDEEDVEFLHPSADIVQLTRGQFIIPGFIDTHIHACQVPNTGIGYDKTLLDWLNSYTFKLESRFKDVEFAKHVYTAVVKRTVSCGTTTAAYYGTVHHESCNVLADVIHQTGQRAWVGKVNMDKHPTCDLVEETSASINSSVKFIQYVNSLKSDLVRPIITPRFALSCSLELMKQLGLLAENYNLCIQTHMSETKEEISVVKKDYSLNYAEVYNFANLLNRQTILAHCVHLEDSELLLLREKKSSVSHCPNSNICLQSGLCDVRRLLLAGINVSLGTDVAGGCNPSVLDAIRSALFTSVSLSFRQTDYQPLSYHEAFYLATMGGAIALNQEKTLGNLTAGKFFDAIIVDTGIQGSPMDVLTDLTLAELFQKFIYTGDDRNISKVYVHGNLVHHKS